MLYLCNYMKNMGRCTHSVSLIDRQLQSDCIHTIIWLKLRQFLLICLNLTADVGLKISRAAECSVFGPCVDS